MTGLVRLGWRAIPRMNVRAVATAMASMGALAAAPLAEAQDADAAEIARQLANPLANLISVPIQNNFDFEAGVDGDGYAYTLNVQPVVPFAINEDWNVISRTIVPFSYRDYIPPPDEDTYGLGDITQSFFISPGKPGPRGTIWGVGPAILIPVASDELLGNGHFGLGPTGVVVAEAGQWTYGALANHIWTLGTEDDPVNDLSQSFVQPFVNYHFGQGTSLILNTESTYDWIDDQWTVPVNLTVSRSSPWAARR